MNVIVSFLLAALMVAGLASGVSTTTTASTDSTANVLSDGSAPMPLCGPDDKTCNPGPGFPK